METAKKEINFLKELKLIIDYTKTFEEALSDGKYDWVDNLANSENFPTLPEMMGKKVEVSAKIFDFNYVIESKNISVEMEKIGYYPGTPMELAALGLFFPELQKTFSVVSVGSVWIQDHLAFHSESVCALTSRFNRTNREFNVTFYPIIWGIGCHFLGIKKDSIKYLD